MSGAIDQCRGGGIHVKAFGLDFGKISGRVEKDVSEKSE